MKANEIRGGVESLPDPERWTTRANRGDRAEDTFAAALRVVAAVTEKPAHFPAYKAALENHAGAHRSRRRLLAPLISLGAVLLGGAVWATHGHWAALDRPRNGAPAAGAPATGAPAAGAAIVGSQQQIQIEPLMPVGTKVDPALPFEGRSPPLPSVAGKRRPRPTGGDAALVWSALRQLRQDHDAKSALATLNEHRRRFPESAMRAEAEVARAEALLQLGRVQEAERVLDGLSETTAAMAKRRLKLSP